jgi:hypothetical protein
MRVHGLVVDAEALRQVRVTPSLDAGSGAHLWQSVILAGVSPRTTAGISLHPHIHVRPDLVDSWPLLAHELVHWHQAQTLGIRRFLWQYVREYVRRLARTGDTHQAYMEIPFEVEARRVARDAPAFFPSTLYRPL